MKIPTVGEEIEFTAFILKMKKMYEPDSFAASAVRPLKVAKIINYDTEHFWIVIVDADGNCNEGESCSCDFK